MSQSQAFQGRIQYSDVLLRQLEDTLSVCIANAKGRVKLSRKPKVFADHFYCGFEYLGDHNYLRYTQRDAKSTQWVVTKAIKRGAATASVWLGVRLRFDSETHNAYLTSVSVLVLAQKASLFPLVRAEWDYRGLRDARHAQPHWHVLTALQASSVGHEGHVGEPPADFDPVSQPEALSEAESLHLAMSANWPQVSGRDHVYGLPAASNLRNWIERTVEYSIEQVQYALNKARTPADPEPHDFRPMPEET